MPIDLIKAATLWLATGAEAVGAVIIGLGVVEGLTKVFYPQGSATVIFVIMVIVLLARPAGLFGKAA